MKQIVFQLTTLLILSSCGNSIKISLNDTEKLLLYNPLTFSVDGINSSSVYNPSGTKADLIITSPSGEIIVVPVFATKEVSRYYTIPDLEVPYCISKRFWETMDLNNAGQKVVRYQPVGNWEWKAMFNPSETGEYRAFVILINNGKKKTSNELTFHIKNSDRKGFIQVARGNPRAFEYQNGANYIPAGNNLSYALTPVSKDRIAAYREWIFKLANAKANIIRLWLGADWCFGLEGSTPYNYNQEAGFLLDSIFKMCQERDISIILCLDYVRNLKKSDNKFAFYRDDYPYMTRNGGTCNNEDDFLLQESAKDQWKAMMRYSIARWGAYTSLFSIELWNEMDCFASERKNVVKWTEEMCAWLKQNDPYNHLITNSLGSAVIWPELWNMKDIDYVNYHDYGGDRYKTLPMYDVFAGPLKKLYEIEKPLLLSECGLVEKWLQYPAITHSRYDSLLPKDTKGYAFHESLWIGLMGGGAGSGMHWWWDVMVNDMNYYNQYNAFSELTSDIPTNKFDFKVLQPETDIETSKCFARESDWGTLLWIVNTRNNWRDLVINQNKPVTAKKVSVRLRLKEGQYNVFYYNSFTGNQIMSNSLISDGNTMTIKIPEFTTDIFVKVIKGD